MPRALIVGGSDISVSWKIQPRPSPLLVSKKARLLQPWTVSWGMSHPSPKKNGGEREAND